MENDSYSFDIDNTFELFKSIDDIIYLIYSNNQKSIIVYNLIDNKKINTIKNAHNKYISNFRHHFDKTNKRDLILSISDFDNNMKIWNVDNFECLYNFMNVNTKGYLYSACFLDNLNKIYIITSNCTYCGNSEPLKVFDLKGNYIKSIFDSSEITYFTMIYYDKNTIYLITGNKGYSKSYNYNDNKIYHKYFDKDFDHAHKSIIIYDGEKITKLIEASIDGNIRIWNFHLCILLNMINVCNCHLYSICFWNEKNIVVGCKDSIIRLIDFNNGKIIDNLLGHSGSIITVKIINHPKYGNILISHSYDKTIKLWLTKN